MNLNNNKLSSSINEQEVQQFFFYPRLSINSSDKPNLGICTNKLCGRALVCPYYVFFGYGPIKWIRECTTREEEEEKVNQLRYVINTKIRIFCMNKRQANLLLRSTENAIQRYCQNCYNEHKDILKIIKNLEDNEKVQRRVAISMRNLREYERTFMLQSEVKSDIERYVASLPNPSRILAGQVPLIFFDEEASDNHRRYKTQLTDLVRLALGTDQAIHGSVEEELLDELYNHFIRTRDNKIPNEYELTTWLQKYFNCDNDKSAQISHCKIFDLNSSSDSTMKKAKRANHRYKLIVHFFNPKNYWIKIDV
jgi:hypothetical protein